MPWAFLLCQCLKALFAFHHIVGDIGDIGAAADAITISILELIEGVLIAHTKGGAIAGFLAGSKANNHGQSGEA